MDIKQQIKQTNKNSVVLSLVQLTCYRLYFQIIEQKEDGIWKGSLMKEGRVAKAGYFPADHVVLIDNNGKSNPPLCMSILYCQ